MLLQGLASDIFFCYMIFRFVLLNAANTTGFATNLVLYLIYRTALCMKCTLLILALVSRLSVMVHT
jgi:hypothetical protein